MLSHESLESLYEANLEAHHGRALIDVKNNIRVIFTRMRKVLQKTGLTIKTEWRQGVRLELSLKPTL